MGLGFGLGFRVGFRVSEVGGADEESHAGANDVTRMRGSWLEAAPVTRAAARGGERRELLQHLARLGGGGWGRGRGREARGLANRCGE